MAGTTRFERMSDEWQRGFCLLGDRLTAHVRPKGWDIANPLERAIVVTKRAGGPCFDDERLRSMTLSFLEIEALWSFYQELMSMEPWPQEIPQ